MDNYLIGVDIGGTSIKFAFVYQNGNIKEKWEIPTNKINNGVKIPKEISTSIKQKLYESSIQKEQIVGLCAGAPGYVDVNTGLVYEAVNLGWKNFNLRDELLEHFNFPVYVLNDANLAALGELWMGAGNSHKNVIAVTLGTGVGGGIVVDGNIINGTSGSGGEIGHIIVTPNKGAFCNCGRQGCIETYASATGIVRQALDALQGKVKTSLREVLSSNGTLTAKDVFDHAKIGDEVSREIIKKTSNLLGFMLGNLATVINPKLIIIGGGVSKAGEGLMKPLRTAYEKYCLDHPWKSSELKLAQLGNDAGVIGAAYYVKQQANKIKSV